MEEATLEDGTILRVIDTPGLGEEGKSNSATLNEVAQSVRMASPLGVSALLYVLSLSARVTEEEIIAYDRLVSLFGPMMRQRTVVVWTHGSSLGETSLEEYLEGAPPRLRTLLDDAGGGSVILENETMLLTEPVHMQVERVKIAATKALNAFGGHSYDEKDLILAEKEANVRHHFGFKPLGALNMKQARRVRQELNRINENEKVEQEGSSKGVCCVS